MKTKTKMVVLMEIAVVLCSVFLAALPVISAEQNTHEVSEITTASEADYYVLGIYGNANEDDTIDMRDVTYTKLVIFGKKPETELADAYYDDEVDVLDVVQIKLIILGRESELTIVDDADRIVTVSKPITRIIPLVKRDAEIIGVLGPGAEDKIVGVSDQISESIECNVYLPWISELPTVGSWYNPDCEAILLLDPDLVIAYSTKAAEIDEKLSGGIAVVGFGSSTPKIIMEQLVKFGYILDENDKVEYYTDDFHDKYLDIIKAETEELSEEEKPKVYVESYTADYKTYTSVSVAQQFIDLSGGSHIFADLEDGPFVTIDPEEVVEGNPDVIIKYASAADAGFGVDDTSEAEVLRDSIMNRPELATVTAVVNGNVYIISSDLSYGLDYPVLIAYWAKWFHPDIFSDLDPKLIHQEYLTRFHEVDYDLDEHGVFVYPETS